MTNIKHFLAFATMAALAVVVCPSFAQEDDLDKLLGELEGDSAKVEKKADDKKADEKAKGEAKTKDEGEEKKSADKKSEEKKEEVAKEGDKEEKKVEVKADEKKGEEKKAEVKADEKKEEVAKEETKEEKQVEKKAEEKKEEVAEAEEVTDEKKEEKKAEEKKEEVAEAEEVTEEKKEEKKTEGKKEEVAEAEEVTEEKKEEKNTEEKKEEVAEAEEVTEEKKEEKKTEEKKEEVVDKSKAKEKAEEKAEDEGDGKAEVAEGAKPAAAAPAAAKSDDGDAELLSNLRLTEELRRKALDAQANHEYNEAEDCMLRGRYEDAVLHYGYALKYLNDKPNMRDFRRMCEEHLSEGLYRWAKQEDQLGRRSEALKLMEQARDRRHPKANRQIEKWLAEDDPFRTQTTAIDLKRRQNEDDYKAERIQIRKHLKRARECFVLRDMEKALEECEIVLAADKHNQEALRLRSAIQRKRQIIYEQQREQAREGMIADVDDAWRPVYAVNAKRLDEPVAETVKSAVGEESGQTQEQEIEERMKKMRLPAISFKPPATIIDAVEFFRSASKDFDRPDIPIEKRGFNFVLKTPQGAIKQQTAAAADEQEEGFGEGEKEADASQPTNGLDPIPTITASDITFYEALKLVCESVDYKFIVKGPVVMVMQKDMSTAELLARKYDVLDAFLERMTAASSDVKEMQSAGFGGGKSKKKDDDSGEENQERDWKAFFEQMGVKWPEGSSIMYIKTLGKLFVRNTAENLAEFEKVLQDMGSQPKLIEIETRFVEVSQEDLNSLGFEWILNSDYSLNLNGVSDKLIKSGVFGTESGSTTTGSSSSSSLTGNSWYDGLSQNGGQASELWGQSLSGASEAGVNSSSSYTRTVPVTSSGANWISNPDGISNLGINAFGGTSEQQNGNRYLSTTGNHISGESASTNDQFMRVNAFLGEADLSMILHMLSQRSDTDLLSAPKVVTKSGENAVIKVVTEYIYPQDYNVQLQSSSSSSGSSSSGSSGSQSAILAVVEPQNFTMREQGVILDVTPTYTEANGGTIDMELKPQVVDEPTWYNYGMKIPFTGNTSSGSMDFTGVLTPAVDALAVLGTSLSDTAKAAFAKQIVDSATTSMENLSTASKDNMTWYEAPMKQPFFHVRSIDSKVQITPGATVVMGGLITEQRKAMDDKIPFLGDLPFIGRLFRSHAEQTVKRNLLIFVTGRLITPSGRQINLGEEEETNEGEVKAAPKAE